MPTTAKRKQSRGQQTPHRTCETTGWLQGETMADAGANTTYSVFCCVYLHKSPRGCNKNLIATADSNRSCRWCFLQKPNLSQQINSVVTRWSRASVCPSFCLGCHSEGRNISHHLISSRFVSTRGVRAHLFQELCEGVGSRLQLGRCPHGLADIFEHLQDGISVHGNL